MLLDRPLASLEREGTALWELDGLTLVDAGSAGSFMNFSLLIMRGVVGELEVVEGLPFNSVCLSTFATSGSLVPALSPWLTMEDVCSRSQLFTRSHRCQ